MQNPVDGEGVRAMLGGDGHLNLALHNSAVAVTAVHIYRLGYGNLVGDVGEIAVFVLQQQVDHFLTAAELRQISFFQHFCNHSHCLLCKL